ncbi:MAG: aldo/keto reductase [Desulfobulbus sp.]|nr:MAG: aldo/keto reductase [Desulfobulbus sp.]
MKYRIFGRTGLSMPVLSCGLMRSMYSWQDKPFSAIPGTRQQELSEVVEAAFACGITHFETARGYGSSERQLAGILSHYDRHQFILQTKVHPEDDPVRFIANVEDSLRRLKVERVDLLSIHGINDYHSLWQSCRPGGCLAAARSLQKKGRVDWVGFSGHGDVEVLLSAIRHEQDGGFDYLNVHWYTIWQRNARALAAAAKRNMGVFIISPTDKGGMLQAPPGILCALSQPLTPMQFNDLYCLQRPEVHTIAVGAARPADFTAHVDALSHLQDSDLAGIIYEKWQKVMQERCGQLRPDALWDKVPRWQETPGYINIGLILWLYNLAKGWGLLEYSQTRYRKMGVDMPWVPGNNAADVAQYDLAEIAVNAGLSKGELTAMLIGAHQLLG